MIPSRSETSPTPQARPEDSSVRRNLFSAHLTRRRIPSQSSNNIPPPTQIPPQTHFPPTNYAAPTLPPPGPTILPRSPFVEDLNTFYEPETTNPISPTHNSIIALNPTTGRPLLPNLPTLPPHLRLSSADTSSDPHGEHYAEDHDPLHHNHHNPDPTQNTTLHDSPTPHPSSPNPTALSNNLVALYYRHLRQRRTATKQKPTPTWPPAVEDAAGEKALEGEEEELMALLTGSLRKKVAAAEEERWMFEGGGGTSGVGAGWDGLEGVGRY